MPQSRDGFGDAGDELADAGLALGRADLAVEVLGGDDVGRGHGPVDGDLDVLLLEDDLAAHVIDGGGAALPLDLVVGRDAGFGELAGELEAGGGSGPGGGGGRGLCCGLRGLGHWRLLRVRTDSFGDRCLSSPVCTGEPRRG